MEFCPWTKAAFHWGRPCGGSPPYWGKGSGVQAHGPALLELLHSSSLLLPLHSVRGAATRLSNLIQGIRADWGILMPPLPRSCFHIWALYPCHPALKSTALLGSKVIGGGDSHSNAAIHTLSSSASKAWPGNANNKQTIITHNCGWTQPLMTLFNTASTLWRASLLRSHAPRSISRLALAGVIPTAYSNCFARTAQGSQPAVKPDAFCKNRLLQGNKWLFFPEAQLPARYHRGALTLTCAPPRAAHAAPCRCVQLGGSAQTGLPGRHGLGNVAAASFPRLCLRAANCWFVFCFAFWVKTKQKLKKGEKLKKKKKKEKEAVSANTGFCAFPKEFWPKEKGIEKVWDESNEGIIFDWHKYKNDVQELLSNHMVQHRKMYCGQILQGLNSYCLKGFIFQWVSKCLRTLLIPETGNLWLFQSKVWTYKQVVSPGCCRCFDQMEAQTSVHTLEPEEP